MPRSELTHSQLNIIELPVDKHLLVRGPPGSGKTMVLVHRARFLVDNYRCEPGSFRIFVFTNVLKDYIRSGIEFLDIPIDNTLTFDDWCRTYYEQNIGRMPFANRKPDFSRMRRQVLDHLRVYRTRKLYKFLLIDEGQDLDQNSFAIATHISEHVTIFGDNNQQVYDQGIGIEQIRDVMGGKQNVKTVNLIDAFRCSPYVAQMASKFLGSIEERAEFLHQHPPVYMGERQKPLLNIVQNREDEKEQLFRNIQVRLGLNERIAILFPTRRYAYGYAQGLNERGLEVEVPAQGGRKSKSTYLTIDFNSPRPKAMPYPSAKGLTFDTVFLPLFSRDRFRFIWSEDLLRKWVFVGISRTVKWIYISAIRDEVMFLDDLLQLESEDQLTVCRNWLDESMIRDEKPTPPIDTVDELDDFF